MSSRCEPVLALRGFHHWFLQSCTVPSCLPSPSRLEMPTRPVVVGAASRPHLRLQVQAAPSFSGLTATVPQGRSFHPPSVMQRFVAHPREPSTPRGSSVGGYKPQGCSLSLTLDAIEGCPSPLGADPPGPRSRREWCPGR